MSKHTPGPWEVEDDTDEVIVSRDPEANGFQIVAKTYGPDDAANARLIAAAPDLLAALKHVRDIYADIEIVRDAIAKAEGGP
jgi:hypothetical protein